MPDTRTRIAEPIEVEGEDDDSSAHEEPMLDRLENVGRTIGAFVVERPLTAVAIAIAAGFMIGRISRR